MEKPASSTTPDLMDEMARRFPDRVFLIDGETRLNYSEFRKTARGFAKGLHTLGLGKGDRVGILMGNRIEWLVAYFGAMTLGIEAVGLNTWMTARELAYQLSFAEVRILVTEPRFKDRALFQLIDEISADPGTSAPPRLISLDASHGADGLRYEDVVPLGAEVPDAVIDAAQRTIDPGDPGCILFTSGSTALPKCVPLPHGGLIGALWAVGERMHLSQEDRLWLGVSLFWSFACVNALFALMTHGGSVVLQYAFDPGEALRLIEQERCTVFYGTPAMTQPIYEHPDRVDHDLSSLRTGATIGSPEQIGMLVALGAKEICNVYGLTEAYGNSCVIDAHDPLELRLRCSGPPYEGNEIKIADFETGEPKPPGERGEICIRGFTMKGYDKDPERTAEVFDEDGFLHTGDFGHLDANGYLTFEGRLKEIVKTGGINVAPAEVEHVLMAHEAIEQAYVTGIPDDRLDEALAAVIVLNTDATASSEDLIAFCRDALSAYKVPRHYRFVEAAALPLTTTGKLQRIRLKELFLDA